MRGTLLVTSKNSRPTTEQSPKAPTTYPLVGYSRHINVRLTVKTRPVFRQRHNAQCCTRRPVYSARVSLYVCSCVCKHTRDALYASSQYRRAFGPNHRANRVRVCQCSFAENFVRCSVFAGSTRFADWLSVALYDIRMTFEFFFRTLDGVARETGTS